MSFRARFIDPNTSVPDNLLFIGAFLIGVSWILVSRLVFNAPAIIALVAPASVLIGYSGLLLTGTFRLREDRAGDNLYYLGFLFTLVALGVGLYRYNTAIGGVENIIRDLGVGLSSTILGLFLRIMFLQLRVDPDEASDDARLHLSQALEEFRDHVHQMSRISSEAQTVVQQQYAENAEEISEVITSFKKTLSGLTRTVSGFDKKIDAIEVPSDIFVSIFGKAEAQIDTAVGTLSEKLNSTNIDLTPLKNEITGAGVMVTGELESLAHRFKGVSFDENTIFRSINKEIDAVAKSFTDLTVKMEPLGDSISTSTTKQRESSQELSEVIDRLKKILSDDSPVFAAFNKLSTNIERYTTVAEQIEQLPMQLESTLEKASSTSLASEELTNTVRIVSTEFNQIAGTAEALRNRLEEITAQFERTVASLVAAAAEESEKP